MNNRKMYYPRMILALLVLGLGLWFGAHPAAAQATATLRGRVIQADGTPVVGATITALSTASEDSQEFARTTTGANGEWQLSVPAGTTVWAHFNTFGPWWGYSYSPSFNLAGGGSADGVDFVLAPRTVSEVPTAAPEATATSEPVATATPMPMPTEVPPGMPSTGNGGDGGNSLLLNLGALALLAVLGGTFMRRRLAR